MIDSRTTAIAACGVSAGIHAALFAVHMRELPLESAGFLTASLLLALTAFVLALRPDLSLGPAAAAALFVGLLLAYPLLRHEAVDFLAVASKLVEAIGLVASLRLLRIHAAAPAPGVSAVFLLCVALGLMLGGGHHAG